MKTTRNAITGLLAVALIAVPLLAQAQERTFRYTPSELVKDETKTGSLTFEFTTTVLVTNELAPSAAIKSITGPDATGSLTARIIAQGLPTQQGSLEVVVAGRKIVATLVPGSTNEYEAKFKTSVRDQAEALTVRFKGQLLATAWVDDKGRSRSVTVVGTN